MKKLSSNRIYYIHYDRLSNPFISSFQSEPLQREINEIESSNHLENPTEPDEDLAPVSNPDEALIR